MYRSILTFVFMAAICAALSAQQSPQQTSPSDPYAGVSNPPADDTIVATQPDQATPRHAKPRAGKPLVSAPAQSAPVQAAQPAQSAQPAPVVETGQTPQQPQAAEPSPTSTDPNSNLPNPDAAVTGNDDGIVAVAPPPTAAPGPSLSAREAADPDGDIVHPNPPAPGELTEGTMIRVHLLTELSTAHSQRGDEFRARVASDVIQDGQVLIPTGSEVDGRVVDVSHGTTGGHGTMRLRPDWLVLPDGSQHRLDAQVTGTPGSNARVSSEGIIAAGSRYKKDGLEYGAGVGAAVVTGAVLGGPAGALAGGLIGGAAITVHLLTSHPQATLEAGAVVIFSLNSPLKLQAPRATGN